MATGCAVACGDVCSIPEVVGNAAMMFDPRNPDSIADTIEPILRDPEVGERLVKEGRSRATLFSWEKAARKTLEILESAPPPSSPSKGTKALV